MNGLNVCACQGCPNTYTPDKNGTHKFCSTP